ncbi:MAG: 30S ribosome-binding factor RbfA [Thermodesulfobacteriota bacterium]
MTSYKRSDRVGDLVRKEIATMLLYEIKDPRVGFVTITSVSMSVDLRQAKIYFSMHGSDEDRKAAIEGLQSASSYIKRMLGKRVSLKYIPKILFKYDDSLDYGNRIERLIEETRQK